MKKYLVYGLLIVVCFFVLPSSKTEAATSVSTLAPTGTAGTGGGTLVGSLSFTGSTLPTTVGFNYGSTTAYGSTITATTTSVSGTFSKFLSVDSCGVTYHYAAFATNSAGTVSGIDRTVTPTCPPSLFNNTATSVTQISAILSGRIVDTGGSPATSRGFEYATSSSLLGTTLSTKTNETGSFSVGDFTKHITGLMCNTTYNFRAKAANAAGTGYGYYFVQFKTLACGGGTTGTISASSASKPVNNTQTKQTTTPVKNTSIKNQLGGSAIGAFDDSVSSDSQSKYTFTQNLTYGSTGEDVARLQKILSDKGYLNVPTLGDFYGLATMNAVKKLQSDNGLSSVGVVGPATLELLNK